MQILKVDLKDTSVKKDLIEYLAKHEAQALFILGNLKNDFQPSDLYVAKEKEKIIGVLGYYPTFKSCSIFSESSLISKKLTKAIIDTKQPILTLLGMKDIIKPAYEEFLSSGFQAANFPEQAFFELSMEDFKPHVSAQGVIQAISEKDVDRVVILHRILSGIDKKAVIEEEERQQVRSSKVQFGLKLNNEIVSVASSNGLARKVFQILGVATDPNFRGKGYAKAVCSHLISYMKDKRAEKAVVFTGIDNVAARKCYLDLGFKITDKYYMILFKS